MPILGGGEIFSGYSRLDKNEKIGLAELALFCKKSTRMLDIKDISENGQIN